MNLKAVVQSRDMSSVYKPAGEEETPIAITVSSQHVNNYNTPMVYAQPYEEQRRVALQTPYAPYSDDQRRAATSSFYIITPFGGNEYDEKMVMVSALSRSMKLLAIFDLVLLLILAIWNLIFLFGIWGPICGFYGAKRFSKHLVYIYAAYWVIRATFDFVIVLYGGWWFILSLIVDLYIFSYIWTFARALGSLDDGELNRLQSPPDEVLLIASA